jgi:hypothetical protein
MRLIVCSRKCIGSIVAKRWTQHLRFSAGGGWRDAGESFAPTPDCHPRGASGPIAAIIKIFGDLIKGVNLIDLDLLNKLLSTVQWKLNLNCSKTSHGSHVWLPFLQ